MEMLQQRERERQEALAAQEKASAGSGADDLSAIVYEDRPMLARPWISATTRDTHDEDVEALNIHHTRQLVRVYCAPRLREDEGLMATCGFNCQIKISVTKMSDEFNARLQV
ncbi:hypothetical protein PINS_up019397 [Pythium insidiosum]|nr:hypothetical protein PINS_up019397 [Pythium insidiosum]